MVSGARVTSWVITISNDLTSESDHKEGKGEHTLPYDGSLVQGVQGLVRILRESIQRLFQSLALLGC